MGIIFIVIGTVLIFIGAVFFVTSLIDFKRDTNYTLRQNILHNFGFCPRQIKGHRCTSLSRCGWKDS